MAGENKNPILVLGGNISTLGIFKAAERVGVDSVALDQNPKAICFSAGVGRAVLSPNPITENDKAANFLVEKASSMKEKPVLFPMSDSWLEFVARNEKQLKPHFHYGFMGEKKLESIINKRALYKSADKAKVLYPRTFDPKHRKISEIARDARHPTITKAIESERFTKKFGTKGFRSKNANELKANYKKCVDAGFDVMIQEIIEGGEEKLYTYGPYTKDGEVVREFMGRKLRQWPLDFGTCTLAESLYEMKIIEPSKRILRQIKYSGPSQVEFKLGEDGNFYMLEVNPRLWLWHSLSGYCGSGIAEANYLSLTGQRVPRKGYRTRVKWWLPDKDWQSFRGRNAKGRLTAAQWLSSLSGRKEITHLSWNYPGLIPRKIFSSLFS